MTLSKFTNICDPKSAGFVKLTKVANNRLKKGNLIEVRDAYNKQLTELLNVTTDEYMQKLAKPRSYQKHTTLVNKKLREVVSKLNNDKFTGKIKTFKHWQKFIEASNEKDVVDNRINYLQRFFDEYRNDFIKNVYVDDLPYNNTTFSNELKAFVALYAEVTRVTQNGGNGEPDPMKIPQDYYVSKQQVQTVWRCDFVIATRILENIFARLKLKLTPKFKEIADIAIIFENGISAFSVGRNQINVLIAPTINYVKRPNNTLQLHSTTEPAYTSGDVSEMYYLHGVYVTKAQWDMAVKKTLTFDKFLKIKNMEQRRVVSQEAGADCFAKHPNAEWSEKSLNGNRLITIKNAISATEDPSRQNQKLDIKILNYKDPSTTREYNSFVPARLYTDGKTEIGNNNTRMTDENSHELTDPDEAMAWKFGKTKEEYYGELVAEA